MEARLCSLLFGIAALCSVAATYPTRNFHVTAPTAEVAQKVALAAERFRKELAIEWLGRELPPWSARCPIQVRVGQLGAGGATTFSFHPSSKGPAEVCGWDMQIQGSLERILDSVLPHEISHTIFACHFRRPLPRWADEGAATLVEHESERRRQVLTARQVIDTKRRIPLKNLLTIKEYPKDPRDIMTLYAEGYSLAEFLVQKGGKARYLRFLNDAHQQGWDQAIETHYEYPGIDGLEKIWHEWVVSGSPELNQNPTRLVAETGGAPPESKPRNLVLRAQGPDIDPFLDGFTPSAAPNRPNVQRTNDAAQDEPANHRPLPRSEPRRRLASATNDDVKMPGRSRVLASNPEQQNWRSEEDGKRAADAPEFPERRGDRASRDSRRSEAPSVQPRREIASIHDTDPEARRSVPVSAGRAGRRVPWSEIPIEDRPSPFVLSAGESD
jgi:hypothetical protein